MTNLGLIGYNKLFLYVAVGASGITHDAWLLKKSSIYFNIIDCIFLSCHVRISKWIHTL